jgi:hypothetical protein
MENLLKKFNKKFGELEIYYQKIDKYKRKYE